jgi:uncharacterized membrane protein HdeD (DUF308 family)
VEKNLLKQPGWLRGFEVATGLLSLDLGVLVLVFPGWGVSTLVILLSFGLIFAGFRSIFLVGFDSLPTGVRVVSVIAGILMLIMAFLVSIFPGLAILTLLTLVSVGLLAFGISRICEAYVLKIMASWIRGMIAALGVIDIILSILVLVLPGLALLTLTAILAFALIISGTEMIVSGAKGRTLLGDLVKAAEDEIDAKPA